MKGNLLLNFDTLIRTIIAVTTLKRKRIPSTLHDFKITIPYKLQKL